MGLFCFATFAISDAIKKLEWSCRNQFPGIFASYVCFVLIGLFALVTSVSANEDRFRFTTPSSEAAVPDVLHIQCGGGTGQVYYNTTSGQIWCAYAFASRIDITNLRNELKEQIDNIPSDDMESGLTQLRDEIGAMLIELQGEVQENDADIVDVKNTQGEMQTSIRSNSGTIETQEQTLQEHAGSIRSNSGAIETQGQALQDHAGSINSNSGRIDAQSQTLQEHTEGINSNSGRIDAQGMMVDMNEAMIASNSDIIASLATQFQTVQEYESRINMNEIRSTRNSRDIENNRDGVALALALQSPSLQSGQRFSLTLGTGFFEGSNAVSISSFVAPLPNVIVSVGAGFGLGAKSKGYRASVTYGF